eukprot:1160146-Pelagomonas_calceolata.AAC.7
MVCYHKKKKGTEGGAHNTPHEYTMLASLPGSHTLNNRPSRNQASNTRNRPQRTNQVFAAFLMNRSCMTELKVLYSLPEDVAAVLRTAYSPNAKEPQ